jgi:hypothetical protein
MGRYATGNDVETVRAYLDAMTLMPTMLALPAAMTRAGLDPPDFTTGPFWRSFWIAAGIIMVVVLCVGAIIALVTRIEQQATETQEHLFAGKHASAPFEDLVEANVHLRALARAASQPGTGASR